MGSEAVVRQALAVELMPRTAAESNHHGPLTPREKEVAVLIARGLTNREISRQLVLSERTVDAHVDHIRQKLSIRVRAQIATWITSRGLE